MFDKFASKHPKGSAICVIKSMIFNEKPIKRKLYIYRSQRVFGLLEIPGGEISIYKRGGKVTLVEEEGWLVVVSVAQTTLYRERRLSCDPPPSSPPSPSSPILFL